ncbi:MAG: thiamine-phosphate synthase family protein [Euryarchaeota archaeon]|uniref:thiamine-phosphate synthase family protein n=1 Tax=Methanobacterium sp. MZD130B TaxID=3394378 RepID=UPI001760BFDB|nr:thiamine-phosphate synthase family protein [Euryarchaeota archaeon]HHT18552.1 thiamine-phosphate synthase [Methanobacterium sp.]
MILEKIERALQILEQSPEFAEIIPEVRSNIVMARKNAQTLKDVAGIPGRVTIVNGMPKAVARPDYGVSSHMARLVISIMKYDPDKRSALNIKYHPNIVEICQKLGLKVSSYDRNKEPPEFAKKEGSTIPWGVKNAVENLKDVPDVIYHIGAWGKEPMIVIVGENPVEVAKMAICIAKLYLNTIDKF